jgi:hypothetical protein
MADIPLTFEGRIKAVGKLIDIARQREQSGVEPSPLTARDEVRLQAALELLELARKRLVLNHAPTTNTN